MKHRHAGRWIALAGASCLMVLLTGCTGFQAGAPVVKTAGKALHGGVHGGQQPIAGAAIALYAAGVTGYSSPATSLLTTTVRTDANGGFDVTGDYTCTAGQQLYLVASGGNPGAGTNSASALMAALGDCSTISASTYVNVNEVTTIGSVFALAPFMSGPALLGTSPANKLGLAHAFASVNKLVNTATGQATGSALPTGAIGPNLEIDTLADILASCVNSYDALSGSSSPCGSLFSAAGPDKGTVPTDTIGAALSIAHNPTQHVSSLFNLTTAAAPFQPQLGSAPVDWTLAVTYPLGSMNLPQSTTVDAAGNIWVANAMTSTVSVLSQSGVPLAGSPFSGNGLNTPVAIAIDAGGNGWVTNKRGDSVSVFTPAGAVFNGSPFSGSGTLNVPVAIAIDAPGNIWIANSNGSSISELTSTGSLVQVVSTGSQAPTSLAINPN